MNNKRWDALCEALDRANSEVGEIGKEIEELEKRRTQLLNRSIAKGDKDAGREYFELEPEWMELGSRFDAVSRQCQRLGQQVTNEATRRYEATRQFTASVNWSKS